jgi:hypothetical protein
MIYLCFVFFFIFYFYFLRPTRFLPRFTQSKSRIFRCSSLVVVIVRVLQPCCALFPNDRCGLMMTRTTTLHWLSFVGWCQNDSGVGLNAGGGLGRAVAFI